MNHLILILQEEEVESLLLW